jgi:type VI secretion system protein VasI
VKKSVLAILPFLLLPTVSFAKPLPACTEIQDDKKRLKCFDNAIKNLKKLFDQPPDSLREKIEELDDSQKQSAKVYKKESKNNSKNGKWEFQEIIDPIDDSKLTGIYLGADQTSTSIIRQSPILVIQCHQGDLNLYVNGLGYLRDGTEVVYRIDKQAAEKKKWVSSKDGRGAFYPDIYPNIGVYRFIKSLEKAKSLVVKMTPQNSESSTAIFDIMGLSSSLNPLRGECQFPKRGKIAQLKEEVDLLKNRESELYETSKNYNRKIFGLNNAKSIHMEDIDLLERKFIQEGRGEKIAVHKDKIAEINKKLSILENSYDLNGEESYELSEQIKSKEKRINELARSL